MIPPDSHPIDRRGLYLHRLVSRFFASSSCSCRSSGCPFEQCSFVRDSWTMDVGDSWHCRQSESSHAGYRIDVLNLPGTCSWNLMVETWWRLVCCSRSDGLKFGAFDFFVETMRNDLSVHLMCFNASRRLKVLSAWRKNDERNTTFSLNN
jgi:hypothetical protein